MVSLPVQRRLVTWRKRSERNRCQRGGLPWAQAQSNGSASCQIQFFIRMRGSSTWGKWCLILATSQDLFANPSVKECSPSLRPSETYLLVRHQDLFFMRHRLAKNHETDELAASLSEHVVDYYTNGSADAKKDDKPKRNFVHLESQDVRSYAIICRRP